MPPKVVQSKNRSPWLRSDLSLQRKDRTTSPSPPNSRPSTPSGSVSGDRSDKRKALSTAGMAIDGLKKVSELSDLLRPLGLVCDALKFAVDTAEAVLKNEDDTENLLDKLRQQLSFIQEKSGPLTDGRFRPSQSSIHGLVKSVHIYTLNVDELQDDLEKLQRKNKRGIKKLWNRVISAEEDKKAIESCTRQLEESFRLFMDSVTFFIADQTAELLALQTFNQLQYVQGSQGSQHSRCLEGTRQAILQEISQWEASADAKPVYALIDRAGTGKSTISMHIVHTWEDKRLLAPRFFFSKPLGITSGANLPATLAHDMGSQIPFLRSLIIKALHDHPAPTRDTIEKNLDFLVFQPLNDLRKENNEGLIKVRGELDRSSFIDIDMDLEKWHGNAQEKVVLDNLKKTYTNTLENVKKSREEEYMEEVKVAAMSYLRALEASLSALPIIVLDALDECSNDQTKVLESFLQYISTFGVHEAPFKLFFTSRPDEDIMSLLHRTSYVQRAQLSLYSKDVPSNQHDIELYTKARLHTKLNAKQISEFTAKADGLFIWASTAATFILKARDPRSVFDNLMVSTLEEQPLDALYKAILDDACQRVGKNESRRLLEILQLVCVAREPLMLKTMDDLLGFTSNPAPSISGAFVGGLGSLISDGLDGKPVQALHPTFIEYLLRSQITGLFTVLKRNAHVFMTEQCLAILLSDKLHHDICDVIKPGRITPVNQRIKDLHQRLERKISPGLRYAAEYSMRHIIDCLEQDDIVQKLHIFFEKKLLFWVEIMSYLGKIPVLLDSIHVLTAQMKSRMNETSNPTIREDYEWCDETLRMIQPFQASITESALQVYSSALAFSPHRSRISIQYYKKFKTAIPRVERGAWAPRAGSIRLSGHANRVACLSFSPNGCMIASGSSDSTLRLWDTDTGAAIGLPLSGHTDSVMCLSFSPDGRRIASGSDDGTLRLWDADTGAAIWQPLSGHSNRVTCLSFSPDGHKIASGSDDSTLHLWDVNTWAATGRPLYGHTDKVRCLSFSPDGHKIASGSRDGTVRLWSTDTGTAIGQTLFGHAGLVTCLAFSPDGYKIASGSVDKTVRLWDENTSSAISQPLSGHTGMVLCLSFSPDGRKIASGSFDTTVRLWDVDTRVVLVQPLSGHTNRVTCLSFSPDSRKITSGSRDGTVRLWDTDTGVAIGHPLSGHTNRVTCLSFSPDGRSIASGSDDASVRLWDAETAMVNGHPLSGHAGLVICLSFSPDGHRIASGSADKTIRLWDADTGAALGRPLSGHTDKVTCLSFSPDGRKIASGSDGGEVRLWVTESGAAIGTPLPGHTDSVTCVFFSPNGRKFTSGSDDGTVRLWDADTGLAIGQPLSDHMSWVTCISFSPDSRKIASGSVDKTIRLWDADTGAAMGHALSGHTDKVRCLSFTPDGHKIVSGSDDGTVRLWDVDTGSVTCQHLSLSHHITSLEFSQVHAVLALNINNSDVYLISGDPPVFTPYKTLSGPSLQPNHQETSCHIDSVSFDGRWTVIHSKYHIRFCLPSYFDCIPRIAHRGKIAYGGKDGSVMIVDCTHLL